MSEIYVDTEEMRRAIAILAWQHHSITGTQRDIHTATQMADGYEGQLRRKVMAIAGGDEGLVRALANDLDEQIRRLTQITDAFEAADAIGSSNFALGRQMMALVDGGMLLSALPWEYLEASPRERRLWAHEMGQHGQVPLGTNNRHLQEFARSPLLPSGGSEADYWNAFLVFLYVNGTIQTQPPLQTWRSAATASGQDLAGYVATATGLRQENVDAWFTAAETHGQGTPAAIEDMVEMVQAGETIEEHFGFSMEGNWSEGDRDDIVEAVLMVSHGMAAATPEADAAAGVFRSMFEGIEITLGTGGPPDSWYCTGHGSEVACTPRAYDRISPQTIAHELGHTFNARVTNHLNAEILGMEGLSDDERTNLSQEVPRINPYGDLGREEIVAEMDGELTHIAGRPPGGGYQRTDLGYASLGTPWQQHSLRWGDGQGGNTPNEDFADMFLGWAYDGLADDAAGRARFDWMEAHMAEWIDQGSGPIDVAWFGEAAP